MVKVTKFPRLLIDILIFGDFSNGRFVIFFCEILHFIVIAHLCDCHRCCGRDPAIGLFNYQWLTLLLSGNSANGTFLLEEDSLCPLRYFRLMFNLSQVNKYNPSIAGKRTVWKIKKWLPEFTNNHCDKKCTYETYLRYLLVYRIRKKDTRKNSPKSLWFSVRTHFSKTFDFFLEFSCILNFWGIVG